MVGTLQNQRKWSCYIISLSHSEHKQRQQLFILLFSCLFQMSFFFASLAAPRGMGPTQMWSWSTVCWPPTLVSMGSSDCQRGPAFLLKCLVASCSFHFFPAPLKWQTYIHIHTLYYYIIYIIFYNLLYANIIFLSKMIYEYVYYDISCLVVLLCFKAIP